MLISHKRRQIIASIGRLLQTCRWQYGVVKWRLEFFSRYRFALKQEPQLTRLLPLVRATFDHPWVGNVSLQIRSRPGLDETVSRSIYWDTPIAITVFKRSKAEDSAALCMGLSVDNSTIFVRQMQGIAGIYIPEPLQKWPHSFISACQRFAIAENYRRIVIPRASSMGHTHCPLDQINSEKDHLLREQAKQRLVLRYDGTATELGFVAKRKHFEWVNPNHKTHR